MNQQFDFKPGFGSDNHSGVHPLILKSLADCNRGHAHSYGMDEVSKMALQQFYRHFGENIDVHYVFNGTAANVLCLSTLLKPFESVICSDQAHLDQDECGAPEHHLGCKIIPVPTINGKVTPETVAPYIRRRGDQHSTQLRVISIAQPTEVGTVYSLTELEALTQFARDNNLLVHMDGARLANAAVFLKCSFKELTQGVQALSFGGTKNGLFGAEAVILFDGYRSKDFKFIRKQAMQLPSKMRFLSSQFLTYLSEDLWRSIALHSLQTAKYFHEKIADIKEIRLAYPVQSNALFPFIPQEWVKPLKEVAYFYVWDEKKWMMRWMTSFDTETHQIDSFVERINNLRK
ncbi:MAG: threonine aldolase [Bdellovibrionales bacterium]|nr:threonine aldolase [Bdellovibrionales bacterium]